MFILVYMKFARWIKFENNEKLIMFNLF
jgi:hypothetical protein